MVIRPNPEGSGNHDRIRTAAEEKLTLAGILREGVSLVRKKKINTPTKNYPDKKHRKKE
jgi:hypothetical protein